MVDANIPDIVLEPDKTVKKVKSKLIFYYFILICCSRSIQSNSCFIVGYLYTYIQVAAAILYRLLSSIAGTGQIFADSLRRRSSQRNARSFGSQRISVDASYCGEVSQTCTGILLYLLDCFTSMLNDKQIQNGNYVETILCLSVFKVFKCVLEARQQ